MKTYVYRSVTLTSYTGGENDSKPVLSPFGPVRAGLTTKHARLTQKAIPDLVLSELLSYLEKESQILESKLSVASSTLLIDIAPRVTRLVSTTAKTGIDTVLE